MGALISLGVGTGVATGVGIGPGVGVGEGVGVGVGAIVAAGVTVDCAAKTAGDPAGLDACGDAINTITKRLNRLPAPIKSFLPIDIPPSRYAYSLGLSILNVYNTPISRYTILMKPNPSLILVNPKSGSMGGPLVPEKLMTKLGAYGLTPEMHLAEAGPAIAKFIRLVRRRRPESVLIAGGDGTIGAVLKGLLGIPVRFGIIPAGSLNNLASTIGLSGDIDEAIKVIKSGHTRRFDAVRVGPDDVMFEALGLGMFAEIFDKVDWDEDKNVPQLVAASAVQVVTQQPIRVTAVVDGKRREFQTIWLAVANTPKLGALTLDPTSRPDDGRLELLYCRPLTPLELPAYALKFFQGEHLQEEKFERLTAKRIQLSFPRGTVVHIDDRVHHRSRLDIQVLSGALELYAP